MVHDVVTDMGKPKGSELPSVHALKPSRLLVPANWVHAASEKYCTTPLLQLSVRAWEEEVLSHSIEFAHTLNRCWHLLWESCSLTA